MCSVETSAVSCDVYNIEVEGDNSYVAEGVTVHNCEHVQIPELSKGKVVDAVLRDVPIGKDKNGKEITTYYVDLLVATDRKHQDLVRKIEAGIMNSLSMGCFCAGTLITLGDGSKKPIEQIIVGDHVRTHLGNIQEVLELSVRPAEEVIRLRVAGGQELTATELLVTEEHPFWAFHEGEDLGPHWIKLRDLHIGDYVSSLTGEQDNPYRFHRILSMEIIGGETSVYNFEVAGDNSYIANDMAVHNCKIAFSVCSKCGNVAVDETQACDHVRFEKNSTFIDDNGVTRKVAELCGHMSDPNSVIFIDASWVANPAFTGARRRSTVAPTADLVAKLQKAAERKPYEYEDGDFLKAAAKDDPEAPPENAPSEETPAEDTTKDETAPTDTPAEGAPDETAPLDQPTEQNDVDTWKTKIKQKLLDEIGDQIVEEISDELSGDGGGPRPLETLDETLIQPTASRMMKRTWKMKKAWDKFMTRRAGHLDQKNFDKLRYGTYMILTSNDHSILKDYGYSRRDFLAVLSFLDMVFKHPLDPKIKQALASVDTKGCRPKQILQQVVKLAGRKLRDNEVIRAMTWLRMMEDYRS